MPFESTKDRGHEHGHEYGQCSVCNGETVKLTTTERHGIPVFVCVGGVYNKRRRRRIPCDGPLLKHES